MKQPKTPKPVRSSERVRLCVDCKHHYLAGYYMSSSADQYKCRAINPIVDMVTGKETPRMCSMMRNFKHMCGPDAKWFEAKEPNDKLTDAGTKTL